MSALSAIVFRVFPPKNVILYEPQAWRRVEKLLSHHTYGNDFIVLGNLTYDGAGIVESGEGEYATKPIDGPTLATRAAESVERNIRTLPRVRADFQRAVDDAMPYIRERVQAIVSDRVQGGRFYGNGHHVRQNIASNIQAIVGRRLGL